MKVLLSIILVFCFMMTVLSDVNPWQGVKDPMRHRKVLKCPKNRPTDCSKAKAGGIPNCAKYADGYITTVWNNC